MNKIEMIYDRVKDNYPVKLARTSALEGFTIDVPVIYGEADDQRFWLYETKDDSEPYANVFVFSVEYQSGNSSPNNALKHKTHWHPNNIDVAVDAVVGLMSGRDRYPC